MSILKYRRNKIGLYVSLFIALLYGLITPQTAYAANGGSTTSPYTNSMYLHEDVFQGYTIYNGIDVSQYNGIIDWQKVKNAGIEFAIIRVGLRRSSDGRQTEDLNYRRNIEGAISNGIPVGVYMYSSAINEDEAKSDAQYILARIKNYYLSLPVIMDYEFAGENGGRMAYANMSMDTATKNCIAFCETIKSAGYTPMIYANKTFLNQTINGKELGKNYKIWLAQYTNDATYSGKYEIWQYTSSGKIDGINGNVDANFWYVDLRRTYNGIDYSSVFDAEYYLNRYPDIKVAFGIDYRRAFEHFINNGIAEGRQGCADFDVFSYRAKSEDLRRVYGNNLMSYYRHFVTQGKIEGRDGSPGGYYTVNFYDGSMLIDTQQIQFGHSGTDHWVIRDGVSFSEWSEPYDIVWKNIDVCAKYNYIYNGIDYKDVFDAKYYLSENPDLKAAFGDNEYMALKHFVNNGMNEGRKAARYFNVEQYKNRYADLRNAYGDNMQRYYYHFIGRGKIEGRQGT